MDPPPLHRGDVMGSRKPGKRRHGIQNVRRLIWLGLVVAAVVKELRTPADERTWNGLLAGFIPYDLRIPTVSRVRDRLWAPHDNLLMPHPFGVGWTLNLGRVVSLVRDRFTAFSAGRDEAKQE
jgi:hypothetical protein